MLRPYSVACEHRHKQFLDTVLLDTTAINKLADIYEWLSRITDTENEAPVHLISLKLWQESSTYMS